MRYTRDVGLGVVIAVAVLVPSPLPAQQFSGRFITSFDTWEKFDTVGASHKVFRGFQSAILEIAHGNISLHTNMQAATTSTDVAVADESDYRLYNLYLKIKDVANRGDVSLGRVPYFYGVGMGTLDGAIVSARTDDRLYRVTLYGGVTPPNDFGVHSIGSVKDKFALGGQVLFNPLPDFRGGVSYVNRRQPLPQYYTIRANPQTLDGSTVLIVPEPEKEQLGGVDLTYTKGGMRTFGRYDYNFELNKTQYAQLGVRYTVNPDIQVTVYATRREPNVPAGSFFSQFTLKGTTEIEGGADYFVLPGIRTFLRGAFVAYDGDNSVRYSAGIGREDVQLVIRGNTGYAGELASISLQGAHAFFDGHVVPNAGISYMSYRVDAEAPRYTATSVVLGTTLRPTSAVSLDLQGQWLDNFIVKSDFRFVGRLHFWFSDHLNLFD